jgi:hypothetical protein
MPAVEESVSNGVKTIRFDVTPIMSTYLLAFVIGEFEFLEGKTRDGVTMRVWTPLGKVEKGKFALDVGVKVLQYFSDYFDIAYPLPKQDMIAIPDFAAGAMECVLLNFVFEHPLWSLFVYFWVSSAPLLPLTSDSFLQKLGAYHLPRVCLALRRIVIRIHLAACCICRGP